ncbi:MAG: NAD(P)-dependent oxidoreductase [Gemmatimonadaceae bacterium]
MRVLITGAAGFLGRHLCERFAADGHWVLGLDRRLPAMPDGSPCIANVQLVEHDLMRPVHSICPIDAVVHCAPSSASAGSELTSRELTQLAGIATQHAIRLALQHGARFMLVSSGARTEPEREAEAQTHAAHRVRQLDVRIARVFNVYGPNMPLQRQHLVAMLLQQLSGAEPLIIPAVARPATYCYIDDVVEGLVRLLYGGDHRPFDIGSPRMVTPEQLRSTLRAATGSIWVDESTVATARRAPMRMETGSRPILMPKITRTRMRLGWMPQWSLRDGLAATASVLLADRLPTRVALSATG